MITTKQELKTNIIYRGDCLEIMKTMPDNSVDLIYLDPPFQSDKNYEDLWKEDKRIKFKFTDTNWSEQVKNTNPSILKKWQIVEEEKNKEEDEHYNKRWRSNDKGKKDIKKELRCFCAYMEERILECRRILKETGSIYLHCDWHGSHYLKTMLDDVFGYLNFQNEIVWCYKSGGSSKKHFSRKHDTIFFYTKSKKYIFNSIKEKSYMTEGSGNNPKQTYYQDENGKYTLVNMKDWWEIGMLSTASKERIGYPTQKPEALLERIIKASSNKNDIVLDCFCGCGTAIAVANRLNRKFIGIDLSHRACWVMKKRLEQQSNTNIEVIGGMKTFEEYKKMNSHDFADEMIINYGGTPNPKKIGDKGIDGWSNPLSTGIRIPIQVKQWGNNVGVPCLDSFQSAIKRDKKNCGIIIAFGFSKSCYDEVERIKKEENIDISLIEANTLLNIIKGEKKC